MRMVPLPDILPHSRGVTVMTLIATSCAVMLFVAGAWLARDNLQGVRAGFRSGDQVSALQCDAATILSTITDAETGQLGFLLTGDVTYLELYDRARLRLAADFARLDHAPLSDQTRTRRIGHLRQLAAAKLAELARTVALRQSGGNAAALAIVRTNEVRRLMGAIGGEVAALQADAQASQDRSGSGFMLAWGEVASLALSACLLLVTALVGQAMAHRVVAEGVAKLTKYQRALQLSEATQQRSSALLRTIVDTVPGLIYAKDRNGRMLVANTAVIRMIGKPWSDVAGRTDIEFLASFTQGEAIMANDRHVMATGRQEIHEERVGGEGGELRVWLSTKTPLRDATGRVNGLVGVSVDITERQRVEEHLRLMIDELNHRVKNTLATVQSIAAQTLRGAEPAMRLALEMRLVALASAHDVLTRERWEGANLIDITAAVLAPHGGLQDKRFCVSGLPVRLVPRAALAIAMGLHELATNALKYGALSQDGGQVEIVWRVLPGANPMLQLVWTEQGGPTVGKPADRGFGTKLIERSLARDLGGSASIRFEQAGLVCEIRAPLADIAAGVEVSPLPRVGVFQGASA